jgi:hypothetical protein
MRRVHVERPIGSNGAAATGPIFIGVVDELLLRGNVEFSGERPLYAWVAFGSLALWRISIGDTYLRIEGRWKPLRVLLQRRELRLDQIQSARLRGTLVILQLDADEWWTISTVSKAEKIMSALEARGVPVSRDA